MKRVMATIFSMILMINVAMAYTSTVQVKGIGVTVTSNVGNIVEITPKTAEITGWTVKSGNTTVTDNRFVMPAGDVIIEGVTSSGFLLTVDMLNFTRTEMKQQGDSVTVEALTESDGYIFSGWTATGITLSASQRSSSSISFTMPGNAVKLVANYIEENTQTYTVTANINPTGCGTVSGTGSKAVGSTVTLTATSESGYDFKNWEVVSGAVLLSSTTNATTSFTMPDSNVEIKANFGVSAILANSSVAAGSYIIYVPNKTLAVALGTDTGNSTIQTFNPSETILWRVLENKSGQLDIISNSSIGNLALYGATGYMRCVYTLNKLCQDYVNPLYATSARNPGYTSDCTPILDNSDAVYEGEYEQDGDLMKAISGATDSRWLSLRSKDEYNNRAMYTWNPTGISPVKLGGSSGGESGVMPIVSLKPDIKIVGGAGTAASPYIISD